MKNYHSALSCGSLQDAIPLTSPFEDSRGNCVFVWNTGTRDIPEAYSQCDLLYSEPAWPHGLKVFGDRANAEVPTYAEYSKGIGHIITELNKPTVLICSLQLIKHIKPPDLLTGTRLNGSVVPVGFWNGAFGLGSTSQMLMTDLASRYDRVGDFCAGYGNTGRTFVEGGKGCVLSDYNAKCCGYMAANMEGWGQ